MTQLRAIRNAIITAFLERDVGSYLLLLGITAGAAAYDFAPDRELKIWMLYTLGSHLFARCILSCSFILSPFVHSLSHPLFQRGCYSESGS